MTDENKAKVSYRLPQKVVDILKAKPNQSAYLENLIINYENGLIVEKSVNETNKELEVRLKLARLKNLDLDAQIKIRKIAYYDTFGTEPSRQATQAIEQGIKRPQNTWTGSSYGSDETNVSKYHQQISSNSKSALKTHFCDVKKCDVTLDPYKQVFCKDCGATI